MSRPHPAWTPAEWRLFEADLVYYGRSLGKVLFAGAVGEALAARLSGMGQGELLDVIFEAGDDLLAVPVEAARLAPRADAVLALEPKVRIRRRPAASHREPQAPLPHPLKILVAVAAPEEGGGPLLDLERELHTILGAVEDQAQLGRAEVRVLETASLQALGRALEQDAYHVVHLSGHGAPGVMLLEDEDGAAIPVTPRELAGVLARSGRPVPLVVLAACAPAAPAAGEVAGMAAGLVAEGIDRVVAMQTRVTDRYATELARGLYRRLAKREAPTVGAALAQARQELESQRRAAGPGAGELRAAEYATATLISIGDDTPIIDHAADAERLASPPAHQVHPLLPQLSVDDFIGRSRERRTLLRALRDDERFIAEHGRRPGVLLAGIGGVGKSSLAGQAATRLVEQGWVLAARRGPFRLDDLAVALAEGLDEHAARLPATDDLARTLEKRAGELLEGASDEDLERLVGDTLRRWRTLIVLDDFEQNLTEGGEHFADEAVAAQLGLLVRAMGRSKLLITSRHPLPGFEAHLHERVLGPLTGAETRKLVLRLPGLLRRPEDERDQVVSVLGGHPRGLELADALLRRGQGRLPVLDKLTDLAKSQGLRLDRPRDPGTATDEAIRLAERDVLLPQLLSLLDPAEHALLYHAAPSNLPIAASDLALLASGSDVETTLDRCSRLADLTLFVPAGEDAYLVQRWLAEALRRRGPERYRAACSSLAMRRLELAPTDPTYDNEIEALRNLVAADAWDEASQLLLALCHGPFARSQLAVSSLAGELLRDLPQHHGNFGPVADLEGLADLACGFTDKAINRYGQLLGHYKAQAEAELDRADYQRDLSVSYNKLGDLMRAVGRGDEAARLYQQSLDIARRLAEAEPDRADYQRDLSISYNRLGASASERGDPAAAQEYLGQALEIARKLAAQDPGRADLAVDVALSLVQLARLDLLEGQGTLLDEARSILGELDQEGRLGPDMAELLGWLRQRPRE